MNSDPVKAHENLNAQLRHQFRFIATFLQSWFMLSLIIGIPLTVVLITDDEVDHYLSDWVFLFWAVILSSMCCALIITAIHYWYEKRGERSIKKKPLSNLVKAGAEVIDGNVVSQYRGYVFNIAWVGHVKRLQTGAFIVHVYYETGPALDQLRIANRSKLSEWSKIQFNQTYLRFFFTKVLFEDSFKSFQRQMDQLIALLADNGIQPTEKAETKIQLIPKVGFDQVLADAFSKSI